MPRDIIPPDADALLAYHREQAVRCMQQAQVHLRYLSRADASQRVRVNAARLFAQSQHDEADLRRALFEETGGMYPELVTRSDIDVFLPPIGGDVSIDFSSATVQRHALFLIATSLAVVAALAWAMAMITIRRMGEAGESGNQSRVS